MGGMPKIVHYWSRKRHSKKVICQRDAVSGVRFQNINYWLNKLFRLDPQKRQRLQQQFVYPMVLQLEGFPIAVPSLL